VDPYGLKYRSINEYHKMKLIARQILLFLRRMLRFVHFLPMDCILFADIIPDKTEIHRIFWVPDQIRHDSFLGLHPE